jgi:hypothetical protein
MANEEQEIQSAMLVGQLAAMTLYGSGDGQIDDPDDAMETLNALIERAKRIMAIQSS